MNETERCLILSSGRCGSTLLSDLIVTEPETLSVQESLISIYPETWRSDNKVSGSGYWNFLTTPSLQWKTAVRIGAIADEFRYPAAGRWGGNLAALPPIATITLPAISDDPDSLFDLLDSRVPDFPVQTLMQHHLMFLDLLASLKQRRRWVERSGGSSFLADPLLAEGSFDKVVYLTRNLADTALSMSRSISFQFAVIRAEFFCCGFDPYTEVTSPPAGAGDRQVPAEMQCLLPQQITLETLAERGGRVEHQKLLWLSMSRAVELALAKHAPRQLLRMRYEDLIEAPEQQLTGLAEFLGFADPAGWAARSAGQVRRPRHRGPGVQPAVHTARGRGR